MSMSVLVAGIILSCIWLLATVIVKPKKRKILMIIGVVACFILLIYTLQWKPFVLVFMSMALAAPDLKW